MLIEEVKAKIVYEVVSAYVAQVTQCQTFQELQAPSDSMIQYVTSIVRPGHQAEFVKILKDNP